MSVAVGARVDGVFALIHAERDEAASTVTPNQTQPDAHNPGQCTNFVSNISRHLK